MGERKDEKDGGLGDGQGTRVASPGQHSDSASERGEKSTGAGSEATAADPNSEGHDHEHRSGYGGKGGEPDTSSEGR
ncbi:MAG: hypothetical protein ABIY52_01805 [Gemmatimonadaceae bacterium]